MKVKICGITSAEDAAMAVSAGADALGFVLYRKSHRYIEPATVRSIVGSLPPFVVTVGVFVNEEPAMVREVADTCGLMLVQLHGDETAEYCQALGRPVIKAVRLRDRATFLSLAEFRGRANVRGFVIDAYSERAYGGTGVTVDWELAAEAARSAPILLAGGLTPANVGEAVGKVRPYGVDVSSGVEMGPGKKDPDKVKAFIGRARLVSS